MTKKPVKQIRNHKKCSKKRGIPKLLFLVRFYFISGKLRNNYKLRSVNELVIFPATLAELKKMTLFITES